jgi:hypothetical protein
MQVTQRLNPTAFPPLSRLAADLAGMEGFLYGGFDALTNGVVRTVHMDAQPSELLFHLQYFKLASSLLLHFRDQRFQVFA